MSIQGAAIELLHFHRYRVAVVGDLMLDGYLWGHVERISPEAPVPILNIVRRESTLGGAGNVVENFLALGAQVTVLGAVGRDETGAQIVESLNAHGADPRGIVCDPGRKSTGKARLMSLEHGQQVFRMDEESEHPLSSGAEDHLLRAIQGQTGPVDALVRSDYMKGPEYVVYLCQETRYSQHSQHRRPPRTRTRRSITGLPFSCQMPRSWHS